MLLCRRVSHEPSGFEACQQSTLQLIVRTDTSVMWELAVFLADELRCAGGFRPHWLRFRLHCPASCGYLERLVASPGTATRPHSPPALALARRRLLLFNAARIMQPQAWKPLTHILSMCCLHAQASPVVLDILVTAFKAQPPTVTLANFEYLISLLVKAFEAREEQGQLGSAKHILVVLEDAGTWLCASGRQHAEIGEGYPGMTQQQRADLLRCGALGGAAAVGPGARRWAGQGVPRNVRAIPPHGTHAGAPGACTWRRACGWALPRTRRCATRRSPRCSAS